MINITWLNNVPPELATFILSLLPVTEIRASIPIGIAAYDLSPHIAYIISVIGNVIPAILLLIGIDYFSRKLMKKSKFFNKFFNYLFSKTKLKFQGKYSKFGSLGLVLFVAIPFPGTGTWTGSVAAFLFGIEKFKAFILISLGSMIAGFIITLLSLGIFSFV